MWAWPGASAQGFASQTPDGGALFHAAELLRAWQEGRTGFPLVDAGQRQLWHTGWMHNRVRMVSANLLVKNVRQWIPKLGTPAYPGPVVDLKASRQEALDAYGNLAR